MSSRGWSAVTTPKFLAFVAGFAALVLLIVVNDDGYIRIIDDANLLFHEAGHLIFGIFGDTPGLYGGTMGQLLIPLICAFAFLWLKSVVSAAAASLWLFENFFNIAQYIGDARAQELTLVGGGKHDWLAILSDIGQLHNDLSIAEAVRTAGWAGLSLTLTLVAWLWWRYRQSSRQV